MYKCVKVCVSGEYENRLITKPDDCIGECTFVGACIDHDLVLVGKKTPKQVTNPSKVLQYFEKEPDILDDVLIVKTDANGDPIDFDLQELTKLFENIFN